MLLATIMLVILGIMDLREANEFKPRNVSIGHYIDGVYHHEENTNIGGNSKAVAYYTNRGIACLIIAALIGFGWIYFTVSSLKLRTL